MNSTENATFLHIFKYMCAPSSLRLFANNSLEIEIRIFFIFLNFLLCLLKAVQDKLDQMVFLWSDIQALQEEREAKLLDVMDLADKFWCDHCALIATIKDSQDLLRELEKPGVDPSVVKQQQEFVEVGPIQRS